MGHGLCESNKGQSSALNSLRERGREKERSLCFEYSVRNGHITIFTFLGMLWIVDTYTRMPNTYLIEFIL